MIRVCSKVLAACVAIGATFCVVAQEPDSINHDYSGELPRIKPLEPKDALASFKIHAGFRMELVAAEPLVFDPIAMAFDEFGRMYVVEMLGYSERRADLIGSIRLLTDENGDGVFDSSSVFAEGLGWPTAVACYDGGVFVGVPPDILYMKDTDADGRADLREVVFSGFGLNNVQGLLNSFNWDLDNLIHGATSGSGANVVSTANPLEAPLALGGRDFVIDAKARRMAATSGGAQHGLTFDDWGHKFVCHNSDHLIQIMFDDHYLARNPYYSAPGPRKSIAADGPQADVFRISPVEPWRVVRTRLRVKGIVEGPIEGGGTASGYFTSATGVTVYRGDAWPAEYRGNVFVADVGSNLVHRKILTREGVAFRGDRADRGVEFLASTDNWFRPVQFANGPDGCLYVADMYREVIEHPDSLPPVIKKHLDLNSGNDRGRIYRIVPDGFRQPKIPRLGDWPALDLVPLLAHTNAWHAETAQRLIYERADSSVVPALQALAYGKGLPIGRLRAMYVLQSLGALSENVIRAALRDQDPQLRRHALRLAEHIERPSETFMNEITGLVSDADTEVRYQLAFSVGTWDTPQRLDTLVQIALSDGADEWMRVALMSSLSTGAGIVAERLLSNAGFVAPANSQPLLKSLAAQVGAVADADDTKRLLQALESLPDQQNDLRQSLIAAMLDGARDAGSGVRIREQLEQAPSARATLDAMVEEALRCANDPSDSEASRLRAIQTLALASADSSAIPILSTILRADRNEALRLEAVRSLSQFDEPAMSDVFVRSLPAVSPALVNPMLDAIFSRDVWIRRMFAAAETGAFNYASLPSTYRHHLQAHRDETIRALAVRFEAKLAPADVQAELTRLSGAAQMQGRLEKGEAIFTERCTQCHRVRGVGESVGPDLAGIKDWDAARVMLSIVNPNAEINPQYIGMSIETVDDRYLTGILESNTATSITLRMSGGAQTVLKSQVSTTQPMSISLMPEGLTDGLDAQAVADLIAFLKVE